MVSHSALAVVAKHELVLGSSAKQELPLVLGSSAKQELPLVLGSSAKQELTAVSRHVQH